MGLDAVSVCYEGEGCYNNCPVFFIFLIRPRCSVLLLIFSHRLQSFFIRRYIYTAKREYRFVPLANTRRIQKKIVSFDVFLVKKTFFSANKLRVSNDI